MLNQFVLALSLLSISAAAYDGIQYRLDCVTSDVKLGNRLKLELENVDSVRKLSKVYLDEKGKPTDEKKYFVVKSIGPKGKNFELKSKADAVFTGSGNRVGTLLFNQDTKKGTWTEITKTFDESTSEDVTETRVTKVTCDLVQ